MPKSLIGHELVLGENRHAGECRLATLDPESRVRHMQVIGASGTGKSTFILNCILQDIERGHGLAVFDPHGDLIDEVLARIPDSRINDVVLIDPGDEDFPVGFNVLSAHSNAEKTLLASDLVSVFRRMSSSWGDQMNSVLGNAVLAYLESTEGGTLADLRRFLVEPSYRKEFLATVEDPEIVYYWRKEYPLLGGNKSQGPLLTRLDTFLRPKPVRYMVAQKQSKLDFADIMNGRKIFLAKLSQGIIGEENSYVLGTLFVSKFHQMAMGRQGTEQADRNPYFLYIDEMHNFVCPSLASMLAGARKYRLGLILVHQDMGQIQSRDAEVGSAIVANVHTRVCFRLGDADARRLGESFAYFEPKDLQNLATGEAICRVGGSDHDFNLKTLPVPPRPDEHANERYECIRKVSREKYATARALVEKTLETSASPETIEIRPEANQFLRGAGRETSVPQAIERKVSTPGKGGPQHKLYQQLVKQWGESLGFRATIEKEILGNSEGVDVSLEKDSLSIACEISVTTGTAHEVGNMRKCLLAGYAFIFVITETEDRLTALREAATAEFDAMELKRLEFCTLATVLPTLQSIGGSTNGAATSRVKGYAVEVEAHEGKTPKGKNKIVEFLKSILGKKKRDKK